MLTLKNALALLEDNKNKVNSFILYVISVMCALNVLLFNNSTVDKLSVVACAGLTMLLFFLNIERVKAWQLVLLWANFISLAVTLGANKGEGIGLVLGVLFLILSLVMFNSITFDRRTVFTCRLIIAIAIVLLLATSKFQFNTIQTWIFVYDIFGKTINNNTVCILLVFLSLLAVILLNTWLDDKKFSWISTAIFAANVISGAILIYSLSGRIALISVAAFFMLTVFRFIKVNSKLYKVACISMFVMALLVPVVYVYLYGKIGNFTLTGKSFFSGRQIIWQSAFEQIQSYPVFGSGTSMLLNTVAQGTTQSAHNTMVGLWKSVGIIPMVSVVLCFFTRRSKYMRLEDSACISLLVIMFTESFFVDSRFTFLLLVFLLRSHGEVEELSKSRIRLWIEAHLPKKKGETAVK